MRGKRISILLQMQQYAVLISLKASTICSNKVNDMCVASIKANV